MDFAVYGLDRTFQGPRWLDFFESPPGEPAWALWLGHRLRDTEHGVRVGTFPRKRYEQAMCPNGGDPLAKVAFSGAFGLVNLTLPDSSVPRPDGLILALVEHAENQASRHAEWRPKMWEADGEPVPAKVLYFAGAWAGFTDALDEVYVVAIGIGIPPEGLRLTRVTDGTPYGADLTAPLSLAELGRKKSLRPEAWLPPPRRDAFHPDQLALAPTEA
ncbi:hypothetical protein B0I33_102609 [Prauserella shujinwangii]|uniref:Uncharacterized protein n=1 Tax=Prauserella shujinwangii TaxID=1453103 RepID=A0A2T0M1P2_9PSEU|nr:hypothetical protein B0I33_102609 [Prauserella shujinwangii]